MKLYFNGTIITMTDNMQAAKAISVQGGVISKVFFDDTYLQEYFDERIDLKGRTLLPGFIDSHSHITMASMGRMYASPPVGDISSMDKLLSAIEKDLHDVPVKRGKWFLGRGYDNAAFANGQHPTRYQLDAVTGSTPALLLHVSGHVGVCNSAALKALRINKATPDPHGGKIVRDNEGEPTGVLEEAALTGYMSKAAFKLLPPLKELISQAEKTQLLYASYGITTAQDGASSPAVLLFYRWLDNKGKLILDICAYPLLDGGVQSLNKVDSRIVRYKKHIRIAGAKVILDGSPQAKTAWLTEPYYIVPDGMPADYKGYPVHENEGELLQKFTLCIENGWQILAHCNGDAAADQFIKLYSRATEKAGKNSDLRPVMIHAQTVREDQLDEMKKLNMMPSFFLDHVYYWGDWHLSSVLGLERGRRISPLSSALSREIPFTMHQDTPVTPPNMLFSVHNAVNRRTASGQSVGAEFAITPYEALKAITVNAAYQYHEEKIKGSLEAGKLADLVILDKDPLSVKAEEIKHIRVLETIKNGKTIYSATNE